MKGIPMGLSGVVPLILKDSMSGDSEGSLRKGFLVRGHSRLQCLRCGLFSASVVGDRSQTVAH